MTALKLIALSILVVGMTSFAKTEKKKEAADDVVNGNEHAACYVLQNLMNFTCIEFVDVSQVMIAQLESSCSATKKDSETETGIDTRPRWAPNELCTRKDSWGECRVEKPQNTTVWYKESLKDQKSDFKSNAKKLCLSAHGRWRDK